ncbi:MAG: tRNA-ribosyltransferase, partial [Candidatus Heimdallarchaeota archaeon]|nr:tRNA-ribosyltransferase [Candidatus Heimdallarchaeota archaeon]
SRTPTWKSSLIKHITEYSYYRPEIQEFQRRIRERYQIRGNKKVVVIFPCSARKPYSFSKSHGKFLNTLGSISNKKRGYIQELILTSPLGVIPRELEMVYPVAHYDIPVTGDWSYEEKEIAVKQLTNVLTKAKTSKLSVIAHVSNEYVELCKDAEKQLKMKFKYTASSDKTTSSSSLSLLFDELNTILKDSKPMPYSSDMELIQTIADYQYGSGIGQEMFKENCRIRSKPNQPQFIMQDKKQIGVIQPTTGKLSLTLETGKTLAEKEKYFVLFDDEELKGSTLFAVGVVDADPQIRPTDSVVILNKKRELVGVGNAIISGKDMKETRRGPAVKIKQKV